LTIFLFDCAGKGNTGEAIAKVVKTKKSKYNIFELIRN
jgi:hypothetical protein